MKKIFERVKGFISQYLVHIVVASLVLGIVSCTFVSIFAEDGLWYILPAILGLPAILMFLFLIFIGFRFFGALIKDAINNRKK